MKKKDLEATAAGLAYVNAGTVPVLDVMSDPAAMGLLGVLPKKDAGVEPEDESEEKKDKRLE